MSDQGPPPGVFTVVRRFLLAGPGVLAILLALTVAGAGTLCLTAAAVARAPAVATAASPAAAPSPSSSATASRTVRIGVYQNEPKVFMDARGRPAGFFVDLFNAIARTEGWRVVWVPVQWDAGLEALQRGRLDLMPDVAMSSDRAPILDFNKTSVIESWSQLYLNPKFSLEGLSSLAGKRVAVLDGSVQQEEFQKIVNGLNIKVTLVPVPSYERAFEMARAGSVDAAITNRFFGDHFYRQYGLKRSDIVFSLSSLYFATGQGRNADLLAAIDRRLRAWKAEPGSPYYAALTRWLEQPSITATEYRVPRQVAWALAVVVVLLAATTIGVVISRRQVKAQAKHLTEVNESLSREHRRLGDIVEFLPDATFVIDSDKKVVAWNRACETMTGVKADQVLGRGDYAYAEPFWGEPRPILIDLLDLPSAELEAEYKHVDRVGEQLIAESFIARLRDGEGAHLWGAAAPLFDRDGRRTGAIEVVRDVTEQKQVEEALRESELKHRLLFETANDAILLMREGRFIDCNPRALSMYGAARDQLVGASPIDFSPPTQPDGRSSEEAGQERIESALAAGPQSFGWEHHRLDGTPFLAEVSLNALELGGEVLLQAMVRDVSERRETERALFESERKYRELVQHANSIILRWTRDGRITFLNEFGLGFFGYAADEIVGHHVVGTIVPMTDSQGRDLGELMDKILSDPEAFEQSVNENMRSSGVRVWIAWTNRIVVDEQGEVVEVLSVGTDITELKRAEKEIRELNVGLERRVAKRTAELAVARDQAEAADRLKSAFLATMSHELRTPLNSIIGFTGIMLQELAGPLTAEQHKQLEMVRDSSRHLLALINDVLDISKIEAGQMEVRREAFDLRASIEKTVSIVRPLAEAKGLALDVEIAPEIDTLVSDPRRVEQVLINLINNAIKFTDEGAVTLAARIVPQRCSSPPPTLQVSVTDTGIGIKPQDLSELFQPFRQVDTGLSRQHEGTGLGLAICRRLADLLGGEVTAVSEWGKGSVFTFTLPMEGTDDA